MNLLCKNPFKIFCGEIKTHRASNFGYFAMKIDDVRSQLADDIDNFNLNMKVKKISGKVVMCKFESHDGMDFLHKIIHLIILKFKGPHISLWMKSERIRNLSHSSISQWVGMTGSFEVARWQFIKTDRLILLALKGKYILNNF